MVNAVPGDNSWGTCRKKKNSWIDAKENAGLCLKHGLSYQKTDPAEDGISGFLL
jgi:hypothetical protein